MKKRLIGFLVITILLSSNFQNHNTKVFAQASEKKYIVLFKNTNLPSDYKTIIEQAGGKVSISLEQIGAIKVISDTVDFPLNVKQSGFVEEVGVENKIFIDEFEPENFQIENSTVSDLYDAYQWDIKQVTNNGESWEMIGGTGKSVDNKDIIIGVIDTGIDYNHPDLKENYLYGKSFVPGISDSMDENGHGTHVAGAIAANGRVKGIGPDLKLASYRVFDKSGTGDFSNVALALISAADDNVDVVNISLGNYAWLQNPECSTNDIIADVKLLDRAIQYAIQHGVTVIGSAGNNAKDITSPGKFDERKGAVKRIPSSQQIIRVSSSGEEKNLAFYSNYGVGKIDVMAPGGDYGTAFITTGEVDLSKRCLSTAPLSMYGYRWMIGTSMAAAKVAGLAGVIIAQHGKDVLLPSQVKYIIEKSAIDVSKPGYDGESGHGLINVVNALKY